MVRLLFTCGLGWTLAWASSRGADAAIVLYDVDNNGGAAGFNMAVGAPLEGIDFEGIAPGTTITGTTISGVTFNAPAGGAPLVVVNAADTFTPAGFTGAIDESTNKLPATSGSRVLSPGGVELAPGLNDPLENDDLELVFSPGVTAFGFDHLSQSADGISFTAIEVFNQANVLLFSDIVAITDVGGFGGPAGADFWGIIADGGEVIGRIAFDEQDNNEVFPDCNIGFDTVRFEVVPEPASLVLVTVALVAARLMGRRTTRRVRGPAAAS